MTSKVFAALGIFFSLVLTGCASPEYFALPTQRFESPRVQGQWSGAFELEFMEPIYVVVVKDSSETPPDASGSVISKSVGDDADFFTFFGFERMGLGLRLAVLDNLEIALKSGSPFAPGATRVKYQFLGSSDRKAKEWLAAAYGSYLYTNIKRESGDVEAKIQVVGYEAGGVLGYQATDIVMPYVLLNYVSVQSNTEIVNSTQTYNYDGEQSSQSILGLGVRVEGDWGGYLALEGSLSNTNYENADAIWLGSYGLQMGIGW